MQIDTQADARVTDGSANTITIDVLKDLESNSALSALLQNNQSAIFNIVGEIATFADQPVSAAAAKGASASISLNANVSGTLPNGIGLSLAGGVGWTITIANASESFDIAPSIDSDSTIPITATNPGGKSYINVDLDFKIDAAAQGAGVLGPVAISGAVSGGALKTFTFCQPVDSGLNTVAAICRAFSQIVLPLDPKAISAMQTGSLVRTLFNGTFSAEIDVSLDLGDHILAAPTPDGITVGGQKVASITKPSVEVASGLSGKISYAHSDRFALIIDKSSDTIATVSLARALASDLNAIAGFNANITTTAISVAVDQPGLQAFTQELTGNPAVSAAVATAASVRGNTLLTRLNTKLATWASDVTGKVGAGVALDRQTSRLTLFNFEAHLDTPALVETSWRAFLSGDITSALNAKGLTLQPGSGIAQSLKRATTFHFQFFNIFDFTSSDTFFSNLTVQLGPDGTIRLHAEIGDESRHDTQKAFDDVRIYFVANAKTDGTGAIDGASLALRLELVEANRTIKGNTFADTVGFALAGPVVDATKNAIASYLVGPPANKKLTLIYDIGASAYGSLNFTSRAAGGGAAADQRLDAVNWTVFHDASAHFLRDLSNTLSTVSYNLWAYFNLATNGLQTSGQPADRQQIGPIQQGVTALQNHGLGAASQSVAYFFMAGQGFMDLCESLVTLITQAAATTNLDQYNKLLKVITQVVTNDLYSDYAIPTIASLVKLCFHAGTTITSDAERAADNSSLTITIKLS